MKPSELRALLFTAVSCHEPVYIEGGPGIGKSAIVRQVAEEMGRVLYDTRASQMDAVDTRGVPAAVGDRTKWLVPAEFPTEGSGIWFLDELTAAPPSIQAAFYQLILDRRLGSYELPQGWDVIAAGNRLNDRAIAFSMSSALANRFVHATLEPDVDEWIMWAQANKVSPMVIGYIRARRVMLFNHDTKKNEKAFPTPRSWEKLDRLLKANHNPGMEFLLSAGAVGEGAAIEYDGFLKTWRELPTTEEILKSPKSARVPPSENTSAMYAVATSLGDVTTPDNFGRVMIYAQRLPAEFATLIVQDALRKHRTMRDNPEYEKWCEKNKAVLV